MILSYDQICTITCGKRKITEEDGFFNFYRMTDDQIFLYEFDRTAYFKRALTSAGIRFSFYTTSESFAFDYTMEAMDPSAMVNSGFFDVYESGLMHSHIGMTKIDDTLGHFEAHFSKGNKLIEVYFPWSAITKIKNVTIDDGATIKEAKRSKTIHFYGDSITHGAFCTYPSLTYTSQISRMLDCECINTAVGSEVFLPQMITEDVTGSPDYVVIAFGTNDWAATSITMEKFLENAGEMFKKADAKYPNSKVFVISPIWRADEFSVVPTMNVALSEVCGVIKDLCKDFPRFNVIDGQKLVPHMSEFFADGLHPEDLGFSIYSNNLYNEIIKFLN